MQGIRCPVLCLVLTGIFVIDVPRCSNVNQTQLALHYLQTGDYSRAFRYVRREIRLRPQQADLHFLAGVIYIEQGQLVDGVGAFIRALELDPERPEFYEGLREVCVRHELYELVRDGLTVLSGEKPGQAGIMAHLGWAHMELGNDNTALELLQAAVATDSAQVFASEYLGRLYLQMLRVEEAIVLLEAALGKRPGEERLLLALGACLLQQGAVVAADGAFAEALRQSSNPAIVCSHIAASYYNLGLRQGSIRYYEQALSHGDSSGFVLNNLAWTYSEEGVELDRALALAYRAVKTETDNVVYLDTLAEIYFRHGRVNYALALMEHCLDLESKGGKHYPHLRGQMLKFKKALLGIQAAEFNL